MTKSQWGFLYFPIVCSFLRPFQSNRLSIISSIYSYPIHGRFSSSLSLSLCLSLSVSLINCDSASLTNPISFLLNPTHFPIILFPILFFQVCLSSNPLINIISYSKSVHHPKPLLFNPCIFQIRCLPFLFFSAYLSSQ